MGDVCYCCFAAPTLSNTRMTTAGSRSSGTYEKRHAGDVAGIEKSTSRCQVNARGFQPAMSTREERGHDATGKRSLTDLRVIPGSDDHQPTLASPMVRSFK